MYAVIKTGGKQYKVQPGDIIRVEKLDQALGAEVTMNDVLLVGGEQTVVGQPLVKDAAVVAVITKQSKTRKVIIFKKKRRQGYRKFKTHRQPFTELFVKSIAYAGKTAKAETEAVVMDVPQMRKDRITARTEARKAALAARVAGENPVEKAVAKKAATKKVTKKASAKKAKAPAKKKTATKKVAKKK